MDKYNSILCAWHLPDRLILCYFQTMINIAFAFNFNIQRCEIEVGGEDVIVREGYLPLIRTLLDHGIKADLFLSGYSTNNILEIDPGLIDTIKSHLGESFELGTYTYTHPIPQLLHPEEFFRQIKKGMEIDRRVFGVSPTGFLPPELAYSREMAAALVSQGIKWIIILAGLLKKALPDVKEDKLYFPYAAGAGHSKVTVIPAAYQLPQTPERFFKLMMKGELAVEKVLDGVKRFADGHPDGLLLFKRDAETVFIDRFNSGFSGTEKVIIEFMEGLASMDQVCPVTIGQFIAENKPVGKIELQDHLGNTRIETFTEGAAKPLWELTLKVRDKLLAAEKDNPGSEEVERAWEHLLLSHNSDGRIGYWFSEWNPGEHEVAPSRRKFVEDNLKAALEVLP